MSGKVLLVDDSAVQREARSVVLTRAGMHVLAAATGDEALEFLQSPELQAEIGLLITDHCMPGVGGPELVRAVRALLPELPILVLSGLADAEDEYEADDVVFRPKPFPPGELVRLTCHLLGPEALQTA